MKPARPARTTRPCTNPAVTSPSPEAGSTTRSSAARASSRVTGSSAVTGLSCLVPRGLSYPRAGDVLQPRQSSCDGKTTPPMPWNDNAGPGPWGSPPPNDGKRDGDKPKGEGPRPGGGGPRGPGGPP